MKIEKIIGRERNLLSDDLERLNEAISAEVGQSSFLVLGGAGSIGQAVVKEIFKRAPKRLYVVDISENNLVELVRDIRSSLGYIQGDFKTFALDIQSVEFAQFCSELHDIDYVLNLSALKHVRSEKDVFTLSRMIQVNVFNTIDTIDWAIKNKVKK